MKKLLILIIITLNLYGMNENNCPLKDNIVQITIAESNIQCVEVPEYIKLVSTSDWNIRINFTKKSMLIKNNVLSSKIRLTGFNRNEPSYNLLLNAIKNIKFLKTNLNFVGLTKLTFCSCNESDLKTINEIIENIK